MKAALRPCAGCFALLVPLAPAALAGDFYVDVAAGSDANPGTAPDAAWKTLTHALGLVTGELDTIHVAPGDYSVATGEVFPLPLGNALVTGTQGPAVTRVLGSGDDNVFELEFSGGWNVFRLEGLGLIGGASGLSALATADPLCVVLHDMEVVATAGFGLSFGAHPLGGGGTPSVQAQLEDVTIKGCAGGVVLHSSSPNASVLYGTACRIEGNTGFGVRLQSIAGATLATSWFESRLTGNAAAAVRAEASGFVQVGMASCLVAGNEQGIDIQSMGGEALVELYYSTLVDHFSEALHMDAFFPAVAEIEGCIFWGNGEDVDGGVVLAKDSDSEHGAFGTANGNFSEDPQFVDAAGANYELRFGSPCIDAGNAGVGTAHDIDGGQRPSDGDLDTLELLDLGCHELLPLEVDTSGALGSPVSFALLGSPCMMTTLFFAPFGPQLPVATKFGGLRLDPGTLQSLLVTIVLSPDPNVVTATIPVEPALVGLTFSFQSLTQSQAAPKLAALTNVESFTVIE